MIRSSSNRETDKGPLLIVLSGPSGAGKDAILARMKELGCHLERVVTVTTRPPRSNERNHIDYHFVSPSAFQEMLARGEFLEWAKVYGNFYGVPRQSLKKALEKGDSVIKVDVQGVATLKKVLPEAIYIFLSPPSLRELGERLQGRQTESPEELARRLKTAGDEIKQLPLFDYIVFNRPDAIDQAIAGIRAIVTAEKSRVKPRRVNLDF